MIKTLLFDLDGTLIDSIELILASFAHTWEVHGRPAVPREEWLQGVGRPLRQHFGDYTRDAGEIEALVATYRRHNRERHDAMVRPFPGVLETVMAIAGSGAALGIVTSKSHPAARRGLAHCGFDVAWFRTFVTADDDIEPKPHPAPVLAALDHLGADAATAAFVGDSIHDMEAGRRAGVLPLGVAWGPFEADALTAAGARRILSSPADLLKLMA